MTDTTRVERVRRILERETPYRVNAKQIRRVLAVLPVPRAKHRRVQERFVAAIVALPTRLEGQ